MTKKDPFDATGQLDRMTHEGFIAKGFVCMVCWTKPGRQRRLVWSSHRTVIGRHVLAFHSNRSKLRKKR